MDTISRLRQDVISACRILSQRKLVEGFGHVSARIPDSEQFLMTPRIALALVEEPDLLTMNLEGKIVEGEHSAPFEAWLHIAIMRSKPQVNAISRIHARTANIFSVTDRRLEAVHNHGSFFAGGVPVFSIPDLISNEQLGQAVATALGSKPAILLRGNGQVTVGKTIPEAVMMAIYLEEAAEVLYGALQIGTPVPLTLDESKRRRLEALPPVDLERAWSFFKSRLTDC
jgi:ribulose-5-phosphate 4-epimerase/fuculose-1-phosphate aldolase